MSTLERVFEHHVSISPQFPNRFLITLYANYSTPLALFNGEIRMLKVHLEMTTAAIV